MGSQLQADISPSVFQANEDGCLNCRDQLSVVTPLVFAHALWGSIWDQSVHTAFCSGLQSSFQPDVQEQLFL